MAGRLPIARAPFWVLMVLFKADVVIAGEGFADNDGLRTDH